MSHYETLGISKNASTDEIKKAYRKLAVQHHPDKGGNEEDFKRISNAYEVLSDEDKRRQYDLEGKIPLNANMFNPFDLFKNFNINISPQPTFQKVKLQDIKVCIPISMENCIKGVVRDIPVVYTAKCHCVFFCQECEGYGQKILHQQIGPFMQTMKSNCIKCFGKGICYPNDCKDCENTRQKEDRLVFNVSIPQGVPEGWSLRLSGKGGIPVKKNEEAGDLVIEVNIMEHHIFKREGNNLIFNHNVSLKDVLIGQTINVDVFGDNVTVDISHNSLHLREITVKNKGITWKDSTGDLIIKLNVSYPSSGLTDEDRRSLKSTLEKMGW